MTQTAAPGIIDQIMEEGRARVVVTYAGQTGDLADTVSTTTAHGALRSMAQEALRAGDIRGIQAIPDADLSDFVVDISRATPERPHDLMILRPKVAFGA
jgi:hypothetical protein